MDVSEVIDYAIAASDIRNMPIAKITAQDTDASENKAQLLTIINLGIIDLFKRFGLATQSMQLSNVVDGASYTMPADFLHLIYAWAEEKYDLTGDGEVKINDESGGGNHNKFSLFTPSPFAIFVTKDDIEYADVTTVDITYQAVPALMTAQTDVVPLPYQFLECLLLWISYKVHSPVTNSNTQTATGQISDPRYLVYKGACNELTRMGVITPDNQSNTKSYDRAFP